MSHTSNISLEYQQAVDQAVYFRLPSAGLIQIKGDGRIDLIQRQTTNDVSKLSPNAVITTVLTSAAGRILDVLQVFESDGTLLAHTLPTRGESTSKFLSGKIFFMDKVEVADLGPGFAQIEIGGRRAEEMLGQAGFGMLPKEDQFTPASVDSSEVFILGPSRLSTHTRFRLLCPVETAERLAGTLETAGLSEINAQTREILRVESGHPQVDSELTENYTPLELNLDWAISDSKGCYTGQEVIARQTNYDKVTKKLVQLRADHPLAPGSKVRLEDKTIGEITSAAYSPKYGQISLGVIRRPHHQPGTKVSILYGDGEFPAEVFLPSS